MPNPFDEDESPVEKSTGALVNIINVTNSELTCQSCFFTNTDGQYQTETKRLTYKCTECGYDNIIRGIDINV